MRIADPTGGPVAREAEIYEALLRFDGARVIELGCGAAEHTLAIASAHPSAAITALEVDAIQHAKNLARPPVANVRFVAGGAQEIPAGDQSVDVVLMFRSLHHVPVALMEGALREIARVLVPGGLAYVSEPVFAGDLNEITRIYNDEEGARQCAFDALRSAVERGDLELVAERFFRQLRSYSSAEDFEQRMIGMTYRDDRLSDAQLREVRARVARRLGPDGAHFHQPHRVDLLRKPRRTSNRAADSAHGPRE